MPTEGLDSIGRPDPRFPSTYSDAHGSEATTIANDSEMLRLSLVLGDPAANGVLDREQLRIVLE